MAADTQTAFLSYSREDLEFALRLAKDLKKAGANVWMDKLDIRPGQRWDRKVQEALTNCMRLLVILSPSSIDSDAVMDEVAFAIGKQKEVIPVFYRDCGVPFRLVRIQYVDFRTDYFRGFQELLETVAVEQRLESAPTPTPPTERQPDFMDRRERKRGVERAPEPLELKESALSPGPAVALAIEHVEGSSPPAFKLTRLEDGKSLPPVAIGSPYETPVEGRPNSHLMRELRWYLEQFLDYPFHPETDHADHVLDALRAWGTEAFYLLFDRPHAGNWLASSTIIQVRGDDPHTLSWPALGSPIRSSGRRLPRAPAARGTPAQPPSRSAAYRRSPQRARQHPPSRLPSV